MIEYTPDPPQRQPSAPAPTDLSENTARFQAMWEAVSDAILLVDPAGIVRDANPAYYALTGYAPADIIGQSFTRVYPPQDQARALTAYPLAFAAPTALPPLERPVVRADGTRRHVETRATFLVRDGTRTAMVCLIRDITDRKQADAERSRLLREEQAARHEADRARADAESAHARMAILAEATAVLMTTLDNATYMHTVAALMVRSLVDWCQINVRNAETGQIETVAVAGPHPVQAQIALDYARRFPLNPETTEGVPQVIRTGQMQVMSTLSDALIDATITDTTYAQMVRQLHIGVTYIVPLTARGRTFGAMSCALTSESVDRFNPEDIALAQELAQRAALAIDNARLYQQTQRHLRREHALTTALTAVTQTADAPAALTTILHSLIDALGSRSGVIYRYAPSEAALQRVTFVNYGDVPPPAVMHLADYPHTQSALTAQQPRFVTPHTTSAFAAAVLHDLQIETALIVPIAAGGHILGMAFVNFPAQTTLPTPDDVAFAQAMAGQCAQAMDKARLTAELLDERERLAAIIEAAPVAILVTGADSRTRICNAAANTLYDRDIHGLTAEERWTQQPFVVLDEAGERRDFGATLTARALAGETALPPRRCTFAYPDGRRKAIQVDARRIPETHEVITIYQDVTALTDITLHAQRQAHRQSALATAMRVARDAPDQTTTLKTVLDTLMTALSSTSGSIYRYTPAPATLHLLTHVNYPHVPPLPVIGVTDFPGTQQALETHQPCFVTAQTTHERAATLSQARRVSGTLIVPFAAAGQVMGLAYINYTDPTQHPTAEDIAFAQVMAVQCAQAMEKTRLTTERDAERARLATVLDIAPVGIIVWNSTGQVDHMNAEAAAHAGNTPPHITDGAPTFPFTLEHADGRPMTFAETPYMRVVRGEIVEPVLCRVRYSDGTARDLISTARMAPDKRSIIGVSQDITALQQALRERATAQAEIAMLKEADALKNRFIAVVSHELRIPLTGILGYADLLTLRAADPNTVQAYAGKIVASAERLRAFLDEYLDIHRLEAGAETFVFAPLDLGQLVREIIDAMPSDHPHTLHFAAVPPIWADSAKLRRVVENLLSNAAKYSPPGTPITVRVHLREAENSVELAVSDQGGGIPVEAQPHIFEKFYRAAPRTPEHAPPGTGLGLAISQEIMTRMNGTIGFESSPTGTTFWVRLPCADRGLEGQPTGVPLTQTDGK